MTAVKFNNAAVLTVLFVALAPFAVAGFMWALVRHGVAVGVHAYAALWDLVT